MTTTARTSAPRIMRHGLNTKGRDLVVGDIHGTFSVVEAALKAAGFDFANDRLFSVGDLVDRGPESRRAVRFAHHLSIFPCLGNHEEMFLEIYAETDEPDDAILRYMTSRNGMEWWNDLAQDQRMGMIRAFRSLPLVQEIETDRGLVGLVHAEVSIGMDWQTFLAAIEDGDKAAIKSALWGRSRLSHGDTSGVRGIDRIFCGHTITDMPVRSGNIYNIDTGSFVGISDKYSGTGRLTMAHLTSATQIFTRGPSDGTFDLREEPVSDRPFGNYAQ